MSKANKLAGALAGLKSPTKPDPPTKGQGKSKDPNYIGTTIYIRKDTHTNAKRALIGNEEYADMSELVESLLAEWLKTQK